MTTDDFIGKVNDLDGVYASKHREGHRMLIADYQLEIGSEKMKLTKKQKNCPYCHTSIYTDYSFQTDMDSDPFVGIELKDNGQVEVWAWWNYETDYQLDLKEKFNFCPMCGRSLSDEIN